MKKQLTVLWMVVLGSIACSNDENSKKDNVQIDTAESVYFADSITGTSTLAYGESPAHTQLSKIFNFQSTIKRYKTGHTDSCIVTVTVENKITNQASYTVHFTSNFFLGDSSFLNSNVRSYTTGKNKFAEVSDNDFGDIVVADFNFDNREDFAVKREGGGNGGPLYNYYIQTPDTSFRLDSFLSDTMIWFPAYFDKTKTTLTTVVRANTEKSLWTSFQLNPSVGIWKRVEQKPVGHEQ
jgi:hypothetical protein